MIDINAASRGLNMSISYTFHSAGDRSKNQKESPRLAELDLIGSCEAWPIENEGGKLAVFATGINMGKATHQKFAHSRG